MNGYTTEVLSGTQLLKLKTSNMKNVREATHRNTISKFKRDMSVDPEKFSLNHSGVYLYKEGGEYFILNGAHTVQAVKELKSSDILDRLFFSVRITTTDIPLELREITTMGVNLNSHRPVAKGNMLLGLGIFDELAIDCIALGMRLIQKEKSYYEKNEVPLETILRIAIGGNVGHSTMTLAKKAERLKPRVRLLEAAKFLYNTEGGWTTKSTMQLFREFNYPTLDLKKYYAAIDEIMRSMPSVFSKAYQVETYIWKSSVNIEKFIIPLIKK